MDELFKIKLNYKKNYSFGIYNAGFDLFCYLVLENLEDRSFPRKLPRKNRIHR